MSDLERYFCQLSAGKSKENFVTHDKKRGERNIYKSLIFLKTKFYQRISCLKAELSYLFKISKKKTFFQ